jgi:dsDNA-specific endonuclease/ATPase MutS2
MIMDNKYKKKLSGFVQSDQITKELDDLLKYYNAENVEPDLEQTKKILTRLDINKELLKMWEIYN